jgi:hypothetical protein
MNDLFEGHTDLNLYYSLFSRQSEARGCPVTNDDRNLLNAKISSIRAFLLKQNSSRSDVVLSKISEVLKLHTEIETDQGQSASTGIAILHKIDEIKDAIGAVSESLSQNEFYFLNQEFAEVNLLLSKAVSGDDRTCGNFVVSIGYPSKVGP